MWQVDCSQRIWRWSIERPRGSTDSLLRIEFGLSNKMYSSVYRSQTVTNRHFSSGFLHYLIFVRILLSFRWYISMFFFRQRTPPQKKIRQVGGKQAESGVTSDFCTLIFCEGFHAVKSYSRLNDICRAGGRSGLTGVESGCLSGLAA